MDSGQKFLTPVGEYFGYLGHVKLGQPRFRSGKFTSIEAIFSILILLG